MSLLYLAETAREARTLFDREPEADVSWIALGPGALEFLDDQGIDYSIPEDFYRQEEFNEFCLALRSRLRKFCFDGDEYLLKLSSAPLSSYFLLIIPV